MTQTPHEPAQRTTSRRTDRPHLTGVPITRVFSDADQHPYDTVTWERRDVVQSNWKTGETVFEQRGVEFPDTWSVNASTIVTTKYFRGALGTETREWSLRQLIDRVVHTYVAAGREHGYFATDEDAAVFGDELTWLLLHQHFSFNSPVWFNVGTESSQQVSACQPYHSLVHTTEGLIPIGRIVEQNMVGLKVHDARGLTEVVAVKHNGRKQVLRVRTKSGHRLDVTSDHLVWRAHGNGPHSGEFVPAGELSAGDTLAWLRTPVDGIEGADPAEVAAAALAGWLQADGFVGQYSSGTNRSLTIEAMTVNDDEFAYVSDLINTVFPGCHFHVRDTPSQRDDLTIRRIRLYGEVLRPFVEEWELRDRGVAMKVPARLFEAPVPVVAAYLRSLFQAEGYVSESGEKAAHVALAMISTELVHGAQELLGRLGIFARVTHTRDHRADRHDTWLLGINNEGDQELFAELVDFVDQRKRQELQGVFGRGGRAAGATKRLQIASIESIGEMDVYDIQTGSGEYLSSGNLRVHNCFILAVDDTMDSILNWYREEGLIFKGGSGAGLNISRIRSSKELLRSSGGTASGPVSFMRGADASAGTIKSGGATRRAAKMVVLDVDHPDVEEFIDTKVREEEKIRVLRDAGFDMDLGGKDITSVQYQNANNSVRVSDEFMRAVENDGDFALTARTDGSVVEQVSAKRLFRKMAEAAWACADPGIQYDDTINDWHTNPETGRITASNPCFTGDTLVAVADGRGAVRFDELAFSGDAVPVYSKDADGCTVVRELSRIRRTRVQAEIVRVHLDDGTFVSCTPDHLFMLRDGSYRSASELAAGDSLKRYDAIEARAGAPVAINHSVTKVVPAGYADVFDGEVAGTHNFAIVTSGVGQEANGVYVHNCSEYMSLDNSSCNLASLNLMKFMNADGTFAVERFVHAVEVIITAMDVSICFADFPTEAIGATTRDYRQLGIGYANLGALLMASGLPYDSDGGRAMAASITSLMTGTAYRRSAELAGVVGPYVGYARNADAHERVMRKHAAATDSIRSVASLDRKVGRAAADEWRKCLEIGGRNGWRNAQASVLAPTGCLTADTLVSSDQGLLRLSELGDVWGSRWQDLEQVAVATDEGPRRATKFFVNGEEPTRRVVTKGGYRIQSTLAHRIKVVDPESGEWVWKRMADVAAGDLVPMQLGQVIGEPRQVPLPVLAQAYYTGGRYVTAPELLDANLAELVGYFMGDGSLRAKGIRLCVADTDLDVVERIRVLAKELFHLEPVVTQKPGYQEVTLQSVRVAQWWKAAGFAKTAPSDDHSGKGWTPHVPVAVRESNDPEVYAAFLRGLFEADGSVIAGAPTLGTASESFAADVRTLLLVLSIATTTRETVSGWGGPQYQLRTRNLSHAAVFGEMVGFWSHRKSGLIAGPADHQSGKDDRIHLPRATWREIAAASSDTTQRGLLLQAVRGGDGVSRDLALAVLAQVPDGRLAQALGYLFEPVAANEDGGIQPTYDLSVPENVTYVANGFVSHNTIGFMMDCDTTGIEPDFSLVKFKKLVGGGSMQIVNNTVPQALTKLGYPVETIEAIVEHIAAHGNVIDAPGLREEHYAIFDCAVGDRAITPMGHVRMMAAVQAFLSGAISKCVTGDSLVSTTDGLVRIQSWHEGEGADSFRDHVVEVASLDGTRKTDAFYYGGMRPVRKVTLRSGHEITGTPNHRLLVAGADGLAWRTLDEMLLGDYVAQRYGADMWSAVPASLRHIQTSPLYGSQKTVQVPEEMTHDLAFLLGAYASEGHTTRSTWSVIITNSDESVLQRVSEAWEHVFGLKAEITRQVGKCPGVVVSSKTVVEFLEALRCGDRASRKRIPDAVLTSPRSMVLSFLQGLWLDAYTTSGPAAKWAICLDSPALLDDLQALLSNLGIVHSRISKRNADNGKTYDEVYACGEHAGHLLDLVPFLETHKAVRSKAFEWGGRHQSTADIVPGITGRDLYALLPKGKSGPGNSGSGMSQEFSFLCDPRTTHVSRRTLERVAAVPGVVLPEWLQQVLDDNLHFSPVAAVEDAGWREVYDISVPETHAFVANGIVNHNTVNMPSEASVDDVEQIYFEGWRLGLKALAIYRDASKVGQPLSDSKAAAPAVEVDEEGHVRPVRHRLPKRRPSQTVSFTVGGAEGYMTAGSYPDNGLGEVFLKLGKQGSTLAGVMDAFSIAVSIALQYGVPLEAFVTKFVNMRFDPAGMTDDPDIRMAQSIMDYIFRRLALDYLPYDDRAALGIHTAEERAAAVADQYSAPAAPVDEAEIESMQQSAPVTPEAAPEPPKEPTAAPHSTAELLEVITGKSADAPLCLTCGIKMRPAGSCYVCEGCGSTSGCS